MEHSRHQGVQWVYGLTRGHEFLGRSERIGVHEVPVLEGGCGDNAKRKQAGNQYEGSLYHHEALT